jgi:hypothetical protein
MEADDRYVTLVLFAWWSAGGELRSSSRVRTVQLEMRCREDGMLNTAVQIKVSITSVWPSCDGSALARVKVFARESESVSPDKEGEARN